MKRLLLPLLLLSHTYGINAQFVWTKIIQDSIYDGTKLNMSGTAYNRSDNLIYSIANHWSHSMVIQIFDMNNDTVTTIPFSNEPNDMREFTYDYSNQRIVGMRSGRDYVYSIPKNGGAWVLIGNGSQDNSHYGGRSFWNANNNSIGFFGGYGEYSVKNGIWENNGSGWSNPYPNNNNCNPARRNANQLILGHPNQNEVFIFSGQGSCTGSQFETSCSISDPWATDVGTWCWLKDLYKLDLDSYNFTNILPVNDSTVQMLGTLTYDYTDSTFYLIGGYVPPAIYDANFSNNTHFVPNLYKFKVGVDQGFVLLSTVGTPPPTVLLSNLGAHQLFYDGINDRLVWIRKDGVWSIDLCAPVTGNDQVTQCSNYTWNANGQTYTQSGQYTEVLTNQDGCDSTVTLNLTITNSNSSSETVTECNSYTWSTNGQTYTQSGQYTEVLTNTAGCDSTVTLNLTIEIVDITTQPVDQTVVVGNNGQFTVTTSATNPTYQWQMNDGTGWTDLFNAGQFSGVDTDMLTVSNVTLGQNNTLFRCIVTENSNCSDTTDVAVLTVEDNTGIEELNQQISIYPNPTSTSFTITSKNSINSSFKLMDIQGKVVLTGKIESTEETVDISKLSKGQYNLVFEDESISPISIIKN